MPRPRYERETEWYAGPRFRRAVLIFYAAAALLGLIAGLVWTAVGFWQARGL